jgi:hypothetical protein
MYTYMYTYAYIYTYAYTYKGADAHGDKEAKEL